MEASKTSTVRYGDEPGLRFALLLDVRGGCTQLDMAQLSAWTPEAGIVWLHLERDHPAAARWVGGESRFDPVVAEALLQEESRPRVEPVDDGLLIILRMREVIDKLMRFIEYLDAIRDRTSILHDDLSTVISERIARNSNRLAALAALLLPPSVVAGLFGMNVGGVPGVNDTWHS
jgi:Mg2+ and Co2+ transporter CorA